MTNHKASFDTAFAALPLIAILRGITPEDAVTVGAVLVAAGIRLIEVPLNSPDPFASIEHLVQIFGDRACIGGGTVRRADEVERLRRIGAGLVVSPHTDGEIIRATVQAGLVSVPGVLSPTDALAALDAGAHALKLFPMEMIGMAGVRALRAILPPMTRLIAVGGIDIGNALDILDGGCDGIGVGSALYRPGDAAASVGDKARALGRMLSTTERARG